MNIFTIIVILLFALMGGLGIGYLIQIDTGYVRLSWSQWLLETNIWIAAIILVLLYLGLNLFFKTIGKTLAAKAGFVQWREKGLNRRAQMRTNRGLLELAEGNWRKAERHLVRSAEQSSTPLLNYLAAAEAASEQGKYDESDQLLEKAAKNVDGSAMAVGLTQAQLQLDRGQTEASLSTLKGLRELKPHQPKVLKLMAQAYVQLERWPELTELLPGLRKSKALEESELESLQQQVWSNSLLQATQEARQKQSAEGGEVQTSALKEVWDRMPSVLRKSAGMVAAYAKQLLSLGATKEAASLLEGFLRNDWDDELVTLYGKIDGDRSAQQRKAESWLKTRQQNPALLLALGRLAIRNQQWTAAKEYLQQSLALEDSPEACGELGKVLVQTGTPVDANEYLMRAIDGPGSRLAEIPATSIDDTSGSEQEADKLSTISTTGDTKDSESTAVKAKVS